MTVSRLVWRSLSKRTRTSTSTTTAHLRPQTSCLRVVSSSCNSHSVDTLCSFSSSSHIHAFEHSFRTFSASSKKDDDKEEADTSSDGNTESLRDTVNRMKKQQQTDGETTSDAFSTESSSHNDFLRTAAEKWSSFTDEVGKTWQELLQAGQPKSINKVIHPVATKEGEKPYTGSVDIMVIDESENLTAWERMQKRLTEAPIISDVLTRGEKIYHESGAAKAKEKVDHLREDAKEAWETSQNPWVYRISSVYDTLTSETVEAQAVAELRELDPTFTLDDWREDVVEHTLPQIMNWFLQGKINQLKPWLGEGVFKRIAAEITARQQEGVEIDTHVLGIMNSEILAIEVRKPVHHKVNLAISLIPIPILTHCFYHSTARRRGEGCADYSTSFHGPANQLYEEKVGWYNRRGQ